MGLTRFPEYISPGNPDCDCKPWYGNLILEDSQFVVHSSFQSPTLNTGVYYRFVVQHQPRLQWVIFHDVRGYKRVVTLGLCRFKDSRLLGEVFVFAASDDKTIRCLIS